MGNGANFGVGVTSATDLVAGTWYHVAAVYEGTMTTIFVDGAPDGTGDTGMAMGFSDLPWCIGAMTDAVFEPFEGVIDEVRIYDRALTPDEVYQNATAEKMSVDSNGKLAFTWGRIKTGLRE